MAANRDRNIEALQIWAWIAPRLPPDVWLACQDVLKDPTQPNPTDPDLAAGLAELLNPSTTNNRKLVLLRQLLNIIKNIDPNLRNR